MRHQTLIVLIALAAATPALARAKGPRTPRTPSSQERQGQGYTLDVQPMTPLATGDGSAITSGASFGAFLGPNLVVRFTVRGGHSCEGAGNECAYGEKTTAVSLQQFVTNSFFVEAGGMIRRNSYRPALLCQDSNDYYYVDDSRAGVVGRTDSRGATLAIGNQWQWQSFTLGARWLAVYQPLQVTSSRIEAEDGGAVTPGERDRHRTMEKQASVYGPSFLIGFSF